MLRLKNVKQVIYDANIIIFQCFPEERYRIIGLTKLARKLTRFLFNQNSFILVPDFIIAEIERKGFLAIIDDYLNDENIHRIYNHPKNVDETFKFKLLRKIRNNYKKLRQNDNFLIEEYCPSEELMDSINNAFEKFDSLPNIWKFYSSKSTDCLNPSRR